MEVKFTTHIFNNSLKKCLQIMKIFRNKYLKSVSTINKEWSIKIIYVDLKNYEWMNVYKYDHM